MVPKLWTINAMAVELQLDRRTLGRRLAAAGVEPVEVRGRTKLYRIRDAVDTAAQPPQDASADLVKARERLERLRADREEIGVAKLRGELVVLDEAARAWQGMIARAKARFRSVEKQVKLKIPKLTAKDLRIVRKLHDSALVELSHEPLPGSRRARGAVAKRRRRGRPPAARDDPEAEALET